MPSLRLRMSSSMRGTAEQQQAVLAVLRTKCDILWAMLDALHLAYVEPGMIPPGAFVPSEG